MKHKFTVYVRRIMQAAGAAARRPDRAEAGVHQPRSQMMLDPAAADRTDRTAAAESRAMP
jgi:hypothetical protein